MLRGVERVSISDLCEKIRMTPEAMRAAELTSNSLCYIKGHTLTGFDSARHPLTPNRVSAHSRDFVNIC